MPRHIDNTERLLITCKNSVELNFFIEKIGLPSKLDFGFEKKESLQKVKALYSRDALKSITNMLRLEPFFEERSESLIFQDLHRQVLNSTLPVLPSGSFDCQKKLNEALIEVKLKEMKSILELKDYFGSLEHLEDYELSIVDLDENANFIEVAYEKRFYIPKKSFIEKLIKQGSFVSIFSSDFLIVHKFSKDPCKGYFVLGKKNGDFYEHVNTGPDIQINDFEKEVEL